MTRIGRYALFDEIAAGGMARVHIGRLTAEGGFSRTVAIKRLHPQLAQREAFLAMLIDEARLVARVRHPNVVQTLDVVDHGGELCIVLEYVHGQSLAWFLGTAPTVPVGIVVAIVSAALRGVNAAHEAKDSRGEPLNLVHRDLSPHNILVDVDGTTRVLDFGVAKARGRLQITEAGHLKGRVRYMAPEQIHNNTTQASDVFAMGIVLWEALTRQALFTGKNDAEVLAAVLAGKIPPPSARGAATAALDAITLKALDRRSEKRFASALEMARALEQALEPATPSDVGAWVEAAAGQVLSARAARIAEIEKVPLDTLPPRVRPSPPRYWRIMLAGVVALFCVLVVVIVGRWTSSRAAALPSASPASSSLAPPEADPAFVPMVVPLPTLFATPGAADAGPRRERPVPIRRASCDPPYTTDATGRHRYKRECF